MPHGRSWMVLDRDLFVDRALPKYFNHKNFTSFIRIGEFALEGMMPLSSDLHLQSMHGECDEEFAMDQRNGPRFVSPTSATGASAGSFEGPTAIPTTTSASFAAGPTSDRR